MNRQFETRMRIIQALATMMEATPIDKIHVTDLCRTADIGRATFYDYFENVYAVATWYWDQLLDESLFQIETGIGLEEAHVQLFRRLYGAQDFFARAFRTHDYNSVQHYGDRVMTKCYFKLATSKLGRTLNLEEEIAIRLFTAGAARITNEWAQGEISATPEQLAASLVLAAPSILDCLQ